MVMVTERYCNPPKYFRTSEPDQPKDGLQFRLRRGQLPGDHGIGEGHAIVGAVAKGLIGGLAAAAKRDNRPAGESEGRSGGIDDFEFPLDTNGAVILRADFRWHFRIVPQALELSRTLAKAT